VVDEFAVVVIRNRLVVRVDVGYNVVDDEVFEVVRRRRI